MDQAGISTLTGNSRSWVCWCLALIEKLSAGVRDQLRMGVISNSHARSVFICHVATRMRSPGLSLITISAAGTALF